MFFSNSSIQDYFPCDYKHNYCLHHQHFMHYYHYHHNYEYHRHFHDHNTQYHNHYHYYRTLQSNSRWSSRKQRCLGKCHLEPVFSLVSLYSSVAHRSWVRACHYLRGPGCHYSSLGLPRKFVSWGPHLTWLMLIEPIGKGREKRTS